MTLDNNKWDVKTHHEYGAILLTHYLDSGFSVTATLPTEEARNLARALEEIADRSDAWQRATR